MDTRLTGLGVAHICSDSQDRILTIDTEPQLPPLPSEQLLMDTLPNWHGRRAIVISPGRAQLARYLVEVQQFDCVLAWYFDLHPASKAALECHDKVEVRCSADLPELTSTAPAYDLVAMPVLKRGEAELTRELLQQGHERLLEGGYLAVAVDNPKDSWLHEQMRALFEKVTCERSAQGSVYWARKTRPLKKAKNFACQYVFRDDEDRMIQVVSRPGVFAHRRLDPGARHLMQAAEISSQDHVLDMGCGTGAVALAAAFQTSGQVLAVDGNSRAIDCLQQSAQLNGLSNVTCIWNTDGEIQWPVPVDVALANPPYFGDDRIGQHFVDTAFKALRPGGALLVVNKRPNWYEAYFQQILEDVVVFESSRYWIACGRKPA